MTYERCTKLKSFLILINKVLGTGTRYILRLWDNGGKNIKMDWDENVDRNSLCLEN